MPRPHPADADSHDGSASLARGAALAASVLTTVAVLALAGLALFHGGSVTPHAALPWLLVLGMACTAAAVAWALWRQHALVTALRQARQDARALAELIDVCQWRSDSAHRITQLRPPAHAAAGEWAAASAIGQPVWEYFGADAAASAALRSRLEGGARLDGLKVSRLHSDGRRQEVELRGAVLSGAHGHAAGYVASARPLDDDAARDGDLRLLHALLQALPAPVFVLAGPDDVPTRVQRGNGAAAQWLGLKPVQLTDLSFDDLCSRMPPDLRAAVTDALGAASNDNGAARPVCAGWDVQARRIDGGPPSPRGTSTDDAPPRWVLVLAPTAPAAAAPTHAVPEHESFSYTVSHDLRAPIRVVEGFAKILKEDYGRQLDRIGNDHLDRVLGAAARMNSMIDALLALSHLSSRPLSRQPVNLSQLAGYVVDDLRRQSPDRDVAVHIEAGLQTQGDPTLLRMVLENLLGNAWKYSAKRRHAEIWLERGLQDGRPFYTVRDNGAGFDMRFADRLFGVFQRLHSASDFPGTGVGLASVRRIVSRHGGEIWAESAVERGSSFHFTLPGGNIAA